MNLKGLICDLDGTLLDSMPVWDGIGEEYLKHRNLTPYENLKEILKPMSLLQAAQYFKEEYHLQNTSEEIMEQINMMIEDQYKNNIPLKPYVPLFLRQMRASGVKLCIATATDIHLVKAALKRLNIAGYFDNIITCTQAGYGKDKPNIFNIALEMINTKKEETIVVEDALHAIMTAKKAGFLVAGIYDESAAEDTQQIKEAADWYFNSFDEWEV